MLYQAREGSAIKARWWEKCLLKLKKKVKSSQLELDPFFFITCAKVIFLMRIQTQLNNVMVSLYVSIAKSQQN